MAAYRADFTKAGPEHRLPHVQADDLEFEIDMAELEHELRSRAFSQAFDDLEALTQARSGALFFRTYAEDIISRDVLLIRHRRSRNRPSTTRILVNDECSSDTNASDRVIEGREYVLRPLSRLVTTRACTMPEDIEGGWSIGQTGFLLQRATDSPVTHIFHGLNYSPSFPKDTSQTTVEELANRREVAEEVVKLVQSLALADSVHTNYLFSAVV